MKVNRVERQELFSVQIERILSKKSFELFHFCCFEVFSLFCIRSVCTHLFAVVEWQWEMRARRSRRKKSSRCHFSASRRYYVVVACFSSLFCVFVSICQSSTTCFFLSTFAFVEFSGFVCLASGLAYSVDSTLFSCSLFCWLIWFALVLVFLTIFCSYFLLFDSSWKNPEKSLCVLFDRLIKPTTCHSFRRENFQLENSSKKSSPFFLSWRCTQKRWFCSCFRCRLICAKFQLIFFFVISF